MKIKNTKKTHSIEIKYCDMQENIIHNHLAFILNETRKNLVLMFNVTSAHGTAIATNPLRLVPKIR